MKFLLTFFFIFTSFALQAFPMLDEDTVESPNNRAVNERELHQRTDPREVSTPAVRDEEAVQEIVAEMQIAQEYIRVLKHRKSVPMITFFYMLDLYNLENAPGSQAFWSNNNGNISDKIFLLNNDVAPVKLFIPGENNQQPSSTITPAIIFQGATSIINESLEEETPLNVTYRAPYRIPPSAENEEVRKIVHQTFDAFYGDIQNQELQDAIQSITLPENLSLPIKVGDVVAIFNLIPEDAKAQKSAALTSLKKFFSEETLSRLAQPFQEEDASTFIDVKNFHQTLTEPEIHLAMALRHSAETMARAGGVLGGTVLGGTVFGGIALSGTMLGGFMGSVASGLIIGGILGGRVSENLNEGLFPGMMSGMTSNMLSNAVSNNALGVMGCSMMLSGFIVLPMTYYKTRNLASTARAAAAITLASSIISLIGNTATTTVGALHGALSCGATALDYFKPGDTFQKARDTLLTLSKHEEQALQTLAQLRTAQASHKETKTFLQGFFQRLRQNLETSLTSARSASSSSAPRPESVEIEKRGTILNLVESILIEQVDHHITETQKLISCLKQAIQRRAAQKKEHTDWKGTTDYQGRGPGVYYRRPGI